MQASNIFEFLCNFNFKSSNSTTHLITPDHHPRLIYWINLFAILRKRGMCSIVFHRVIILPQHLCIVQHLSELRKFVSRITVLRYSRTCLRKYFCQTGWIMLWLAQHDSNYSSNSSYCSNIPLADSSSGNSRLNLLQDSDFITWKMLRFFLRVDIIIYYRKMEDEKGSNNNLKYNDILENRSYRKSAYCLTWSINFNYQLRYLFRYVRPIASRHIAITLENVSLIDTGWVVITSSNSK